MTNDPFASPYAMMAAQGLNNISALRRNQVPRTTPVGAYQAAINQRALLKQQEQMTRLREAQEERLRGADVRAQEKHMAAMDPAWEFKALQEQNMLPEGMDFTTYETTFGRRAADDPSAVREWEYYSSLSDADKKQYLLMKRAGQLIDMGGGVQGAYGPDGVTPVPGGPTAEGYAGREGALEGAKVTGRGIAETDQQFAQFVDSGQVDALEQSLNNTRALREAIEGGQYQDTGVLEGGWNLVTGSPENARLQMISTMQALQNLQITNLAPVTENEIQMITDLYAKISREPEQNIALLEQAEKMLQDKLDLINKKGQYWADQGGTLRGYGTQRWQPTPATPPPTVDEDLPPAEDIPVERWGRDENGNPVRIR